MRIINEAEWECDSGRVMRDADAGIQTRIDYPKGGCTIIGMSKTKYLPEPEGPELPEGPPEGWVGPLQQRSNSWLD